MADRGGFRGGGHRGGGRGDRGGGHRGGGRGGHGNQGGGQGGGHQTDLRPKKENILDLSKYTDKEITVKFQGGREVIGKLKGYDGLMNLVLDEVKEVMSDDSGNQTTRPLGLIVARGTLLTAIYPIDGSREIANPFQAEYPNTRPPVVRIRIGDGIAEAAAAAITTIKPNMGQKRDSEGAVAQLRFAMWEEDDDNQDKGKEEFSPLIAIYPHIFGWQ